MSYDCTNETCRRPTCLPCTIAELERVRAERDEALASLKAPEAHWDCQQKIDTLEADRDAAIKERDEARAERDALFSRVSELSHAAGQAQGMRDAMPSVRAEIERDTTEQIASYIDDHYCGRDDDPHNLMVALLADIRAGAHKKGSE